MDSPLRIAVVGAGIGGLAVAVGLQRAGAAVTVLERAAPGRGREAGSGLSLFGNGLAALDALGLGAARRERGIVSSGESGGLVATGAAGQRTPDGRLLSVLPPSVAASAVVVLRSELRDLLLSAVDPAMVQTAASVDDVTADGRRLTMAGAATRERDFDVIVGADGIRSRVRASWPDDPGIRYSGYRAWRGVTDRPVDVSGVVGETVGRGLRFGIAPIDGGPRAGCVYWFAVLSGSSTRDADPVELERFARWHDPIPELLAATPPPDRQVLPIEELAGRLPSFRRGRCVLLGDAAHAMTPNLGQGGNQALEDAATLTALLAGLDPRDAAGIDAALDAYDRLRRPRTQRIARQAALLGRVLQASGSVTSRLRDVMLRAAPERAVARQILAVQRWSPPPTTHPAGSLPGSGCLVRPEPGHWWFMSELAEAYAAVLSTVPEPTDFAVETADVDYDQDGAALRGYLARPSTGQGRIGVLIMHDWFGVADNAIMRAQMLARLGYVAFAADIFGADTRPTPEQAPEVAGRFYGDPDLTRARAAAGLEQLLAQPEVDRGRIVVIGYCFGGFVALELARTGADVAGTVTFHGSLKSDRPQEARNIGGKVLVLTGSDDPIVPDEEITDFVAAMREGEVADWQVHLFSGVQHAFTVPGANYAPAVYDATADRRSWAALLDFLGEIG